MLKSATNIVMQAASNTVAIFSQQNGSCIGRFAPERICLKLCMCPQEMIVELKNLPVASLSRSEITTPLVKHRNIRENSHAHRKM